MTIYRCTRCEKSGIQKCTDVIEIQRLCVLGSITYRGSAAHAARFFSAVETVSREVDQEIGVVHRGASR